MQAPGRRVWALEGTGSFAAGFATALAEAGEDVVEITGGRRTRGAKSDRVDAIAAARTALGSEQQATPRARGLREALRQVLVTQPAVLVSRTKAINELKSLIIVAPEHLRAPLRGVLLARQLELIEALSSPPESTIEHRIIVLTLRSIAARIRFPLAQTAELDPELVALVKAHPAGPALLDQPGVGPSWRPRSSSAGHTATASEARPPSPPWPACPYLRPAAVNKHSTGSTAAATGT
jgi:transposase